MVLVSLSYIHYHNTPQHQHNQQLQLQQQNSETDWRHFVRGGNPFERFARKCGEAQPNLADCRRFKIKNRCRITLWRWPDVSKWMGSRAESEGLFLCRKMLLFDSGFFKVLTVWFIGKNTTVFLMVVLELVLHPTVTKLDLHTKICEVYSSRTTKDQALPLCNFLEKRMKYGVIAFLDHEKSCIIIIFSLF